MDARTAIRSILTEDGDLNLGITDDEGVLFKVGDTFHAYLPATPDRTSWIHATFSTGDVPALRVIGASGTVEDVIEEVAKQPGAAIINGADDIIAQIDVQQTASGKEGRMKPSPLPPPR
jgi:hypothetical protein